MRVLVVEDETDIADAVQRFLQGQGHAVDLAVNLAEAAAFLGVAEFDAILLDLALPDGVGLDLLRQERRRGNRVPVIIATARDQIADRIAGLDAGADDYVVKPYDLGEVDARLRAHGRRARGDPRRRRPGPAGGQGERHRVDRRRVTFQRGPGASSRGVEAPQVGGTYCGARDCDPASLSNSLAYPMAVSFSALPDHPSGTSSLRHHLPARPLKSRMLVHR